MIPTSARIFVCTERQDMRRSFDALALAVKERLDLDPQSGALFVFASKRSNRLKVLWVDHNGFCILYKRLHGPAKTEDCYECLRPLDKEKDAMNLGKAIKAASKRPPPKL